MGFAFGAVCLQDITLSDSSGVIMTRQNDSPPVVLRAVCLVRAIGQDWDGIEMGEETTRSFKWSRCVVTWSGRQSFHSHCALRYCTTALDALPCRIRNLSFFQGDTAHCQSLVDTTTGCHIKVSDVWALDLTFNGLCCGFRSMAESNVLGDGRRVR